MDFNSRLCVKIIHCGNVNIINPQDREQKNMFFMPMGLFPLADVLRREGINIEIINLDLEIDKSIEEVFDFNTVDAVGFDCHWVNQGLMVMETAESIKQMNPHIFIFLGGFTASLFAEEIMTNFPQVDAVIRGDGEIPIVELCRVLQENKRTPAAGNNAFHKVKNLAWRPESNTHKLNDISYVGTAEEMEKLDFAAIDLLRNWEYYRKACVFFSHYQPFHSIPLFSLEVGRGCQYACLFCGGNCEAQKRISNREPTVIRSVDSVIETIKKAVSFGFKTFYSCMEFEGSDAWYIELFKRIKVQNLKINYCYGSWKLPSKALIDSITDSCEHVLMELSPETSNHQLRKKNKDSRLFYTNEELEKCLDYIGKKDNMKIQLYFGYYLADDTWETIFNTASFTLEMLIKYPHFLEIEYFNFSTDPGSLFFFYPEKYDIDIKVRNFDDYIKHLKKNYIARKGQPADMILFKPRKISQQEDAEIRREISLMNFLFFSFRKSISYILDKTRCSDLIMTLIKDADLPLTPDNKFPGDKIRDELVERCYQNNILDQALFQLITYEFNENKHEGLKPAPQLYLDLKKPEETPKGLKEYEAYLYERKAWNLLKALKKTSDRLLIKLIHCGNSSIANPLDQGQKNIFYMPMGTVALAEVLKRNGVDVEIIHLDLTRGKRIEEILDFSVLDAVGLDCHWLNQSLVVLETAELIKKIKPGVFIFLGGFTASLFAEEILTYYPQVDAIIRGDAEIPIVELCQALHEEKKSKRILSLDKVQNLAWRKHNNEIALNDISYVGTVEEMEKLDFAAFDLLRDWQYYRSASLFYTQFESLKSSPTLFLEVGRGCQYACTFCGGNCVAQKRMNNRDITLFRSVDSVIKTIEKAISLGFEMFYTCMEAEYSDKWYIELFNRLKAKKLNINYCYGTWSIPSLAIIDALSETFTHVMIEVSPETSNNDLRKKNKDLRLFYSNEQLEEFLDYARNKSNIKVQLCFGYYLAYDTRETIFDTLHYIIELIIKYHGFLEIEYGNFSTDPGSLFFFYPEKYGMDIKVRNFNDFIKYLKVYYQVKEKQPADMTLCRPKYISGEEDMEITRTVMLFNTLFGLYRKSVSYILEKTGLPGIIMEILEVGKLSLTSINNFPVDHIRDTLIKSCKEKNILDPYLLKLIWLEYEKQKSIIQVSKPTTQLYMDIERVENLPSIPAVYEGYFGENAESTLLMAQNKIQEEEFDF